MNDKRIFDILFRRYYGRMYIFAHQFLHVDDDCHDAVSEVFEEVWKHYAEIEEGKAPAYMYQCLRRNCLDRLKHRKVEEKYIRLSSILSEHMTTQEQIEEMYRREAVVEEVLASLPPPTQEIFVQCYVEHRKYQEVAEAMGISASTVKKHIVRALKLIRERTRNIQNVVI